MGRVFPEEWERFALAAGRDGERVLEAYARRLAGADLEDRRAAAAACLAALRERQTLHEDEEQRLQFATLVTHYWSQDAFLPGSRQSSPEPATWAASRPR